MKALLLLAPFIVGAAAFAAVGLREFVVEKQAPQHPEPPVTIPDLGIQALECSDQRYSLQLRVDGLLAQLDHAERTEQEVRALYYDTLRGLSLTRCQTWYENHPRRGEKHRPPDSELRKFCEMRTRVMTEEQLLVFGDDFRRSNLFPLPGTTSSPAKDPPP